MIRMPKLLLSNLPIVLAVLVLAGIGGPPRASATLPEPCENGNCFAVFVMPDTQSYVEDRYNFTDGSPYDGDGAVAAFADEGTLHLIRTMEWICANRESFVEESSGAAMRIELLLHLGDLVQRNERTYAREYTTGECDRNDCEWNRIDQVFSVLDQQGCEVPYLVVPGNHDWSGHNQLPTAAYTTTDRFNEHFAQGSAGRPPWRPERMCSGLSVDTCDWSQGKWYLGGGGNTVPETSSGNQIPAWSRSATEGPVSDQPGRHRAGMVQSPAGDPFLFIGLEFNQGLPYSKGWPKALMSANPMVPTVLFNHQGLNTETALKADLIDAHGQVFLTFNGHNRQDRNHAHTVTIGSSAYDVPLVQRDYSPWTSSTAQRGWNAIAVFDPDRGEVRVRSVQIEGNHDVSLGDITFVAIQGYDPLLLGQTTEEVAVALPDLPRSASDNCPNLWNPDQADSEPGGGDGVGDPCDLCPLVDDPDQIDRDQDGFGDACDVCVHIPNPEQLDSDEDGYGDLCDNCTLLANGPLNDSDNDCTAQQDADGDGYGNPCDTDVNNDGATGMDDVTETYNRLNTVDPLYDFNCDGAVGFDDVSRVLGNVSMTPGPSSLDCAGIGTIGCVDSDDDGVFDLEDNCVALQNSWTSAADERAELCGQFDADADGYGNACDSDVNGDGATNVIDMWAVWYGSQPGAGYDPALDLNCDGSVDLIRDYPIVEADADEVLEPGPSGLSCQGVVPCPDPEEP